MNPVNSHIAPPAAAGPMRIAPMANPPAAEIARQRGVAAGGRTDSIEFSSAARRLAQTARIDTQTRVEGPTRPAASNAAGRLVSARVDQPAFEPPAPTRPADAPLPFYRDPGQANAAATAVAGSRLDVTG